MFNRNLRSTTLAYLDPGSGVVYGTAISTLFGYFLAIFSPVVLLFGKFFKKRKALIFVIILVVISAFIYMAKINKDSTNKFSKKVIVLGFDGMDPKIIEEGIKNKHLPNFSNLKSTGTFSELQTTTPPQSPVAWASFITGTNPSEHRIYDFIVRDTETYEPSLVFSKEKKFIEMPKFWEYLSDSNIPVNILFLPDTYPAQELNGKMFSGMGTPDITGTEGTFTLFTSKPILKSDSWRGNIVKVENTQKINVSISGPKYKGISETKTSNIPAVITKNEEEGYIELNIQNKKVRIKEGEWSPWVKLEFKLDFFTKIHGVGMFYLKQQNPNLELYLSPINIDPEKPALNISFPNKYSSELARSHGTFSTLGLPHDTWALEEDVLSEEAFLSQVDKTISERSRILFDTLDKQQSGVFVGYFGMTDTVQHMFWRHRNTPKSPYRDTILNYYKKMDDLLGEVIKKYISEGDTVIVLSDHGFTEFDYEFNLNTWLYKNGYLFLKDGKKIGEELLDGVDWDKTKAYAVGYNSLYVNKKFRESGGIVSEADLTQTLDMIKKGLIKYKNPINKRAVVKNVYTKSDLNITDDNAPDLIIGYNKGVRASWETAVGATPKEIITKRVSKWSGDHLIDASLVPGVLFSNKKIVKEKPNIIDIAPSLLILTGIQKPQSMQGENIF